MDFKLLKTTARLGLYENVTGLRKKQIRALVRLGLFSNAINLKDKIKFFLSYLG